MYHIVTQRRQIKRRDTAVKRSTVDASHRFFFFVSFIMFQSPYQVVINDIFIVCTRSAAYSTRKRLKLGEKQSWESTCQRFFALSTIRDARSCSYNFRAKLLLLFDHRSSFNRGYRNDHPFWKFLATMKFKMNKNFQFRLTINRKLFSSPSLNYYFFYPFNHYNDTYISERKLNPFSENNLPLIFKIEGVNHSEIQSP